MGLSEQALGWLEPAILFRLSRMELNGCWMLGVFTGPPYLLIRRKTYKIWTVEDAHCVGLDATWATIKAKLAG